MVSAKLSSNNALFDDGVAKRRERVAICVCTYKRPLMLEACLRSLGEQAQPADTEVQIIVVDNEGARHNVTVVEVAQAFCPYPIVYVHEPKRGIASARNRAMDEAVCRGAKWIAFIDDDEAAAPDWIATLMTAKWRDIPVLAGTNVYEYPVPMPYWAEELRFAPQLEELRVCRTAGSGNIRFSVDLYHAGLRFDERLGLTGGEDTDFFARAADAGFEIRRVATAITREPVHPERLTYGGQMYRIFTEAACGMRRQVREKGWLLATFMKVWAAIGSVVSGAFLLSACLLVAKLNRNGFRTLALRGGKKMAKGLGRFATIFGISPKPYRDTVGC